MNKIISINLKGIVFQVEEEAFEQLKKYLEQLSQHFANEESKQEIIDDIESRIAEMMQEKLQTKAAITTADVEEIIATMGNPADFDIDDDQEPTNTKKEKQADMPPFATNKRFMRDTDNSILGGVCAGAGHYFGVEPLWVRLIFLFLFFVMGTGFLFYIILWVIIPEAKTPSDRLQMKGEPVTVDNIEKTVKEEYERLKKNLNNYGKGKKDPITKAVYKAGGIVKDIAVNFAKFVSKIIGFFLLFVGSILFITLVGTIIQLAVNGTLPLLSLAFENTSYLWISIFAAVVFVLTIIIGLITTALSLFNPKRKLFSKTAVISTSIIGAIAFFTLVTMGIIYGSAFSERQSIKKTKILNVSDTLTVTAYNPIFEKVFGTYDASQTHSYGSSKFQFRNNTFNYIKTSSNAIINDSLWCVAKLEVKKSENTQWELEIIRTSYGQDEYMAQAYAEKIPIEYDLNNNQLVLNTHFFVGNTVPFRDQEITYRLWVPQGKVVKFEQGVTEIMDNRLRRMVTDVDYYGMTWAMGENGLRCLDCKSLKDRNAQDQNTERHVEKDFTAIEVNIPVEVNIEQGDEYAVYVSGPYDARQQIDIYKRGSTLKIDGDDNDLFDIFDKYSAGDVVIIIKTPRLEELEANGAAKIVLTNIKTDNITLTANGASNINGEIDCQNLQLELTGSSKAKLKGIAKKANIALSGAAHLEATNLEIEDCDIETSGAANANIWVQQELDVTASGASTIKHTGKPFTLKKSTSGAATIKQEK